MTPDEFRKLALAFDGAEEKSHQNHPDFRCGGKIFATLGAPNDEWAVVKLNPAQQQAFVKLDAKSFVPASGAWGQRGYTQIRLSSAKKTLIQAALDNSFENVFAKPARPASKSPRRKTK
ncbi:MAG: MmcQ/YjbR family DNA-binding protein [Pirellulaceae bacterium]